MRLFDVVSQNPSPVLSFDEHKTNVTGMGFQKEGKWLYTSSEDGLVKIWDMRARGAQQEYNAHSPVNTATLHPNQREIIIGDQSGRVLVWDLMANDCHRELVPEEGDMPAIRSVVMCPDGSKMLAANNKVPLMLCHFLPVFQQCDLCAGQSFYVGLRFCGVHPAENDPRPRNIHSEHGSEP